MQASFPMFQSADSAASMGRCMNCAGPLLGGSLFDSGNADGRGRYAMRCAECGMATFFDLGEMPAAPGPWIVESDGEDTARTYYAIRHNPAAPLGEERRDFSTRREAVEFARGRR